MYRIPYTLGSTAVPRDRTALTRYIKAEPRSINRIAIFTPAETGFASTCVRVQNRRSRSATTSADPGQAATSVGPSQQPHSQIPVKRPHP
eukprot:30914-Prorocentrum_minimum.AAC.1